MTEIFLKLVNMSISAGWLILAVLVLRLVLWKAPKVVRCILWCLVGWKLVIPFSVESVLSLIPSSEVISRETLYAMQPAIDSGVPVLNQALNPIIAEHFAPNPGDSVNPLQVLAGVSAVVWAVGVAILLLYSLFSYLRLKIQVKGAVKQKDNIYQSEAVASPFILGLIRPRIYLPFYLKEEELSCVLAHEKAHIKRGDHLWKPLGFWILTVYWFQPLVWVAYILLCRDIELACDEKVMKQIGAENKKIYSHALLNCSISHKNIAACPLAFGEVGVKQRIKNVLNYKKPTFWIVAVSVVVCVACAVCFWTEPKRENDLQIGSVNMGMNSEIGFFNSEPEVVESLQSPPALILRDSLSVSLDAFEVADAGTYNWYYKDGDLMTGAEACGPEPQDLVKGKEWLQLTSYNKLDYVPYVFDFSLQPDEIILREYDLLELGNIDVKIISETVYKENYAIIPLKSGRIYEVVAVWDESHLQKYGCYGTAHYAFATDNNGVHDAEAERISIQGHVKEIIGDREHAILISSDTDSFPGVFMLLVPPAVCEVEDILGGEELAVTMQETGEVVNKIPVYKAIELEKIDEIPENLPIGEQFTEEVNQFDGVTMTMAKCNTSEGEVEIYNGRDKEIQYGDFYDIQVLHEGQWYSLQVPDGIAYNSIAYGVLSKESRVWETNWEYVYGELPPGNYRMVNDIMDWRAPGDFDMYYLAAEFEIK